MPMTSQVREVYRLDAHTRRWLLEQSQGQRLSHALYTTVTVNPMGAGNIDQQLPWP